MHGQSLEQQAQLSTAVLLPAPNDQFVHHGNAHPYFSTTGSIAAMSPTSQ
jgi:hypothetical protein